MTNKQKLLPLKPNGWIFLDVVGFCITSPSPFSLSCYVCSVLWAAFINSRRSAQYNLCESAELCSRWLDQCGASGYLKWPWAVKRSHGYRRAVITPQRTWLGQERCHAMAAETVIKGDRVITIETEIQGWGKNVSVELHIIFPHNQDAFPHTF